MRADRLSQVGKSGLTEQANHNLLIVKDFQPTGNVYFPSCISVQVECVIVWLLHVLHVLHVLELACEDALVDRFMYVLRVLEVE